MRRPFAILTAALTAALASAGTAGATTFYLSFRGGQPPVTATGGDVGRYEYPPGSATGVVFSETLFLDYPNEEVDAFELLPNGHMILSTTNPATLLSSPTVTFGDGDLVEYDPFNNTAAIILFETSVFPTGNPDVDAVAVLPNGDLLLSISNNGQINVPGIGQVEDGDIIRWDGASASLFLDEDAFFGVDVDIDAFDVASDGDYAFSLLDDANILGLGLVDAGDLVRWDVDTLTATIWLDDSLFGDPTSPLDAVAVPEPGSSALLALGLLGLAFGGRRRPR